MAKLIFLFFNAAYTVGFSVVLTMRHAKYLYGIVSIHYCNKSDCRCHLSTAPICSGNISRNFSPKTILSIINVRILCSFYSAPAISINQAQREQETSSLILLGQFLVDASTSQGLTRHIFWWISSVEELRGTHLMNGSSNSRFPYLDLHFASTCFGPLL